MEYAEKFGIPQVSEDQLAELGAMVDEIEDLCHQDSATATDKLETLNSRLSSPTDLFEISAYSGACSQEDFLRSHLTPDPHQHQNLTDDELIWLIQQIQENFTDEALTSYYEAIVEINTSSPSGTVSINPDADPSDVLEKLKANRKKVIGL